MSLPVLSDTTIGYELTLMAAQPMPARPNNARIIRLKSLNSPAPPNAIVRIAIPINIVLFLPIFVASTPIGRNAISAVACATINAYAYSPPSNPHSITAY